MNSHFLSVALFAATTLAAVAETPAMNTPPGPVLEPETVKGAPTSTAPPQAKTRSAPGAQSPSGANGKNQFGVPVTKTPNTPVTPAKNPAAAPAPANSVAGTASAPKTIAPASLTPKTLFGNYLSDLGDTLKLSASEKQDIQTYYLEEGAEMNSILNNGTLSPLEQDEHIAELRDKRNAKIEALLEDVDRQREFYQEEAKYRVALVELAADGGLMPAGDVPAVAAPAQTPPAEASPSPTPKAKDNETSVGGASKSS